MPKFYLGWLAPKDILSRPPANIDRDFAMALLTQHIDISREVVMVPCKAIVEAPTLEAAWVKADPTVRIWGVSCEQKHVDDFAFVCGLEGTVVWPKP